ncbi:carbohydrate ABC transporter permease [Ktedonosporobacter rubrisoli]|uniref:Carbohydrate ABC transporter permease n=2 Tax=Ktedonosporobacter rubrisoli TaxID=2509675 RepID=A0A4P6K6Z8_KTERU|nr:carbohydrate ABC transporter permease [Ktedonosporobacter rubrisoli]
MSVRQPAYARAVRRVLFWLAVIVVLVFFLFPPVWLLLTSLKNYKDAFAMPPVLIFKPILDNYVQVLGNADFLGYAWHSVVVAIVSSGLSLLIGAPAAYALAKMRFKGRDDLALFVLGSRIAPPLMLLFPLYLIFFHIHVLNSLPALIVTYITMELPFTVWILSTFFEDVPDEIREAALVDGEGEFGAFLHVMLPLIRSGLAATAILCIIQSWNEFLFALILSGNHSSTLPVGITSFMTFQGTQWGPLTAAGTLVMIPILIFCLLVQKPLVRGMTLGAVK